MAGAKIGDNPWRSLAALIILQAKDDMQGKLSDVHGNLTKALIQYDAERWIETSPWCQFLLDTSLTEFGLPFDTYQYDVAALWRSRRKHSHYKYLPEIRMTAWLTVAELSSVTGLGEKKIHNAIRDERLYAEQRFCPDIGREVWHTTVAELAKAIVVGDISFENRKGKAAPVGTASPERRMEEGKGSLIGSVTELSETMAALG
jgi:hypothetical protein